LILPGRDREFLSVARQRDILAAESTLGPRSAYLAPASLPTMDFPAYRAPQPIAVNTTPTVPLTEVRNLDLVSELQVAKGTTPTLKPVTIPSVKATPPSTPKITVAKGATTTPSGSGSRIYEPAPKPVPKPAATPPVVKKPVTGVNTNPSKL
jgi:hypothetical protein